MARAFASTVIEAPVEAVWPVVRDFNGLPAWAPGVVDSMIEDGRPADTVSCVRAFHLGNGDFVRERLLALDDARYMLAYNFETPAFPVAHYRAAIELIPVTDGDRTYAQWHADFDEAPGDEGKYQAIISREVFGGGLAALAAKLRGAKAPAGTARWQGWRPAKVVCSSVIRGPVEAVWLRVRDFAGMGEWHPEVAGMHMTGGARGDQVGGVRDFTMGPNHVVERLTGMSDDDHAFRYVIDASPFPWLNYHAGLRLRPVTETAHTLAVWTADWTAAPEDDVTLIPDIHTNVFQRAFDTLNEKFFTASG